MPNDLLKQLGGRKAIMAPLSPTPCAEISDDELVSISVRDLNRQLKMRGLTRDQIVRFLRPQEWHDMELMQEDNNRIRDEIEALRSKYDALKRFAVMKNIPLPPELELLP
ncbi:transcription factor MafK-like [Leguminivora glycinivorella]|uniref:transcription factor MafK-like n=1 Tax=Leguminivora glycinivorella TaxID=1035111 RepID=UPI00200DD063|nr:transcription factor MafK-like [Leguminivora glycinivorella]